MSSTGFSSLQGDASSKLNRELNREEFASDPARMQRVLHLFGRARLSPSTPDAPISPMPARREQLMALEEELLDSARAGVARMAAIVPTEALAFVEWIASVRDSGPSAQDLLCSYLAEDASLDEISWVVQQEIAGEASFDELAALTQVKMPRNARAASSAALPQIEIIARALGLQRGMGEVPWEALALSNLMNALAFNRRYAFHSVGALAIVALEAPTRAAVLNAGLERVGAPSLELLSAGASATADSMRAESWLHDVVRPLVEERPEVARFIAEGALLRRAASKRLAECCVRTLGMARAA